MWRLLEIDASPGELLSGTCVGVLKGHTDVVTCVAWARHPDERGKKREYSAPIASASRDETVRVWVHSPENFTPWRCAHTFTGMAAPIRTVAWGPGGERLAGGSNDGLVRVWDIAKEECKHTIEAHADIVTALAWLKNGKLLASASDDTKVSVSLRGRPGG